MADDDVDFLGKKPGRTFKGRPAPTPPQPDWLQVWHDEAAGAKPIPVPVKELERQKKDAEDKGEVQ